MSNYPQNPENPNDHPDLSEFKRVLNSYPTWATDWMKSVPTSYKRRDLKDLLYNLDIQVKTLRIAMEAQGDGSFDDLVEPERMLYGLYNLSFGVANAALCVGDRALVMRDELLEKGGAE